MPPPPIPARSTTKTSILPPPKKPLCRFFVLQGRCRNGYRCAFSHDMNGMTREEALQTIPCPFFAKGCCRYGDSCELLHEEKKLSKEESDAVCGICLENVASISHNFGLLSCCNHVFCYKCLMEWRTEGSREAATRYVCPTCRKRSDFVVPSPILPQNDQEKTQILNEYKDRLSKTPCKRFDGRLGSCPFGSDCLYAHGRNGMDMKKYDATMKQLYEKRLRKRRNQNRQYSDDINMLADMIILMGLLGYNANRSREEAGEEDEEEEDENCYHDIGMDELMGHFAETMERLGLDDADIPYF